MKCRHCGSELKFSFVDLGSAPPSNAYLAKDALHAPEKWFPLRVLVCEKCWLVQTEDFARPEELFDKDYAYFSGYSESWLEHSKRYVEEVIERFSLNHESNVVEVAANDGYLLQYVQAHGIPCLGIEPTASTAAVARKKGVKIIEEFFGRALADRLAQHVGSADLMIANNVLAHVPDINDFVSGFARLLKPTGVATFEFPHLMQLVAGNQFDTIYHEHYSYLSLTAAENIFTSNGLHLFDVEELSTHGGSLRLYAQRSDSQRFEASARLKELFDLEKRIGITSLEYYQSFQMQADKIKNDFLSYLVDAKRNGLKIAAYGAAAKGNTLLNYAGVKPDLMPYVADKNPHKQGKFLPGSRVPIVSEARFMSDRPDQIIILPWNLKEEVMEQLGYVKQWGGRFVTAVPSLSVV